MCNKHWEPVGSKIFILQVLKIPVALFGHVSRPVGRVTGNKNIFKAALINAVANVFFRSAVTSVFFKSQHFKARFLCIAYPKKSFWFGENAWWADIRSGQPITGVFYRKGL